MSLANFIPEVWSSKIQRTLEKTLVYGGPDVVNRDHEGEISQAGDTVRINAVGPVTIKAFSRNIDLAAPDTLTSSQTVLLIDQEEYFNFQIDDVDAAQASVTVMNKASSNAAYATKDSADQFLAALMVSEGTDITADVDATPTVSSNMTSFYENLVVAGIALDEANVPAEGRFCIIPFWLKGQLQRDNRFILHTNSNTAALLNGMIGEAAGFSLKQSNNVPVSGTDYSVVAGLKDATTYAEQIVKVEGYRPQLRFGDALKGLHVYGGKVVEPASLVTFTQTRP